MPDWPLACPCCHLPLSPSGRQWQCDRRHSFDLARRGYLNLLPVQQKKSTSPGDNETLVDSRHRFLEAGHYMPILEALGHLPAIREASGIAMDAGCGEGWYTAGMQAASQAHWIGLDISRVAVRQACRRGAEIRWLVASNQRPPVVPGALSLVTCIFSLIAPEAFSTSLKPGGLLVTVTPGSRHLEGLRQQLYENVRPFDTGKHHALLVPYFRLLARVPVAFDLCLDDRDSIMSLAQMTPHFWRAPRMAREALAERDRLSTLVDVTIEVWQKC
jgi:23S rRNA (guanine745-N1)-methyltransferase